MAAKSRPEHLNIMVTPEMDATLRVMALSRDVHITTIVRGLLEESLRNDPLYAVISAYVKTLTKEHYAEMKLEMQNKSLPPHDRIPEEIQSIIKEFGND